MKENPVTVEQFATLVVRDGEDVAAYGPFMSHADARLTASWWGVFDDCTLMTATPRLYRPGSYPPKGGESEVDGLIEMPDSVVALLRTRHGVEPVPDHEEQVAVLVVVADPECRALLVGPHDSPARARAWIEHARNADNGRAAEYYVVPLQRGELDADTSPDSPDSVPAVLLLDLDEQGTVIYGPFTTRTAATLFWHDITNVLELTNVRRAYACSLNPPAKDMLEVPDDAQEPADERIQGWVVRVVLDEHDETRYLVGPFDHELTARAWQSQASSAMVTGTVLPIYAP
jgi:hypothetical protein